MCLPPKFGIDPGPAADAGSSYVVDQGRAFHSGYFEMLGEQGYPGLALWLWIQLLGLWQMERIRWKWKKRDGPNEQWVAPLASEVPPGGASVLAPLPPDAHAAVATSARRPNLIARS